MMRLKELLHDIVSVKDREDCEIQGITEDSRNIQSGDLFLAYPGTQTDGRHYISEAINKGASVILAELGSLSGDLLPPQFTLILTKKELSQSISEIAARFYGYPAESILLIGVTGTNGKSSCTHFIAASLAQAGKPCGIIGGITCGIYTPSSDGASLAVLRRSDLTTPGVIQLQALLAQMRAQGVRIVAVEVSSHGLAQGRIQNLPFMIAAFTNLTHDHLDYHVTLENYAETKKKLFMQPNLKYAIFNQDDAYGAKWQHAFSNSLLPIYNYTINPLVNNYSQLSTSSASITKANIHQIEAQVVTPWGEGLLTNNHLIGSFNVSNLLLVLTVLGIFEVSFKEGLLYISRLRPILGRMQKISHFQKPLVVIDYAHTPDALQKALEALKPSEGKLWCVFGCGGNRDQKKRPMMGAIAEQYADHVIVTQDNPRDEKSEMIIQAILSGARDPSAIYIEMDRARAISKAIQSAQLDDVILIAGKGHETYQTIQGVHYPFSDHQIAKEALALLKQTST